MKKIVGLLLTLACLSISASDLPKPNRCPLTADIKAQGINEMEAFPGLGYIFYHLSNYQTNRQWMFGVMVVNFNDQTEAKNYAMQQLAELTGMPEPTQKKKNGDWTCEYNKSDNSLALAATFEDLSRSKVTFVQHAIQR